MGEIETDGVVVNDAEQDEQQAAGNDVPVEGGAVGGGGVAFGEREREADAGDEKEQREDHVIGVEAGPRDVFELAGPPLEDRPAGEGGQGGEDAIAAHDPEHVEAAEGVERVEAGRGRNGRRNGHWGVE